MHFSVLYVRVSLAHRNFADDVIILTNILSHNNDDAVELFDKIGNGNPFTNTIKLGGGTGSDSIVNIYQTDIGGGFSSPGATIEDDGDMKTNGILTADSAVKLNYNDLIIIKGFYRLVYELYLD